MSGATRVKGPARRPRGEGFHISAVSERFSLHAQTLRLYERIGLVVPSRSQGNTRLYSEDDIRRLEIVVNLTRELGVNLAGVEIILNMREKMERMQDETTRLLRIILERMVAEGGLEPSAQDRALVLWGAGKGSGKGRRGGAR